MHFQDNQDIKEWRRIAASFGQWSLEYDQGKQLQGDDLGLSRAQGLTCVRAAQEEALWMSMSCDPSHRQRIREGWVREAKDT